MTYALIAASVTYCTDEDAVEVSPRTLPYLKRWMRENGYIHESEAPTVTVHRMLATTPAPVVPSMEET